MSLEILIPDEFEVRLSRMKGLLNFAAATDGTDHQTAKRARIDAGEVYLDLKHRYIALYQDWLAYKEGKK
jgi:hypothetical protein